MASSTRHAQSAVGDGWWDLGNLYADDANTSYAETFSQQSTQTPLLKVCAYGFNIPSGATINGVLVTLAMTKYGTVSWTDYTLLSDAGAQVGHPDNHPSGTTGTVTIGSSTDLWGQSLTPSWINDSDFGASLRFGLAGVYDGEGGYYAEARINYVTISVYYTAAAGPALLKTVNGLAVASVKTLRSGLAIASGKTFNGLA
jgi:hypothetical protein